ncbi:uncharacterized protein [Ptychodera flava]|uniref:uncharacterized protein n=1 Tax=Ptychodera flava TaxID=63121 RepID=UPI00396AAA9A
MDDDILFHDSESPSTCHRGDKVDKVTHKTVQGSSTASKKNLYGGLRSKDISKTGISASASTASTSKAMTAVSETASVASGGESTIVNELKTFGESMTCTISSLQQNMSKSFSDITSVLMSLTDSNYDDEYDETETQSEPTTKRQKTDDDIPKDTDVAIDQLLSGADNSADKQDQRNDDKGEQAHAGC